MEHRSAARAKGWLVRRKPWACLGGKEERQRKSKGKLKGREKIRGHGIKKRRE